MGRKKIEIRPLTDERNRNVTFLKRKAGLMKKAWELSVLCAADVSIVIFSAAGKPYEFSSKDLDEEIDRYLDYEGLIERRRAPEFAAMALAGEDSDDDDEGPSTSRRASTAKNAAANGAPPPNKSLKGKESYKNRMPSKAEVSRTIAHYRQKAKGKGRGNGRRSHRRSEEKKSFIDGILEESDSESSSDFDEEVKRGEDDRRKRRRRQDEVKTEAEGHGPMAGLHYAMGLHQQPQQEMYPRDGMLASAQHSATRSTTGYYRQVPPIEVPQMTPGGYPPPQPVRPSYSSEELDYAQAQAQQYRMHEGAAFAREVAMQPQHQHQQHHSQQSHSQPIPQNLPMLPGNMQWDQNLLARYAEFQLQQNHQRQQRILLERQRSQLAELGIPLEDKTLLDQLFGVGGASGSAQALNHENIGGVHSGSSSQEPQYTPPGIPTPHDHGPESGLATGDWAPRSNPAMGMGGGEFEWPTLNGRSRQKEAYAEEQYRAPGADDIPWGIGQQPHLHGQQDEMPFPTPASPANIRA